MSLFKLGDVAVREKALKYWHFCFLPLKRDLFLVFHARHTSKIYGLVQGCGNIRGEREDVSLPPVFWDTTHFSDNRRVQLGD